ncbi:hypothetical protein IAD21_00205 [Abditibacteriota bacterium]|nr:hypothetical protein IAD21_00205 [Abditibacteriota bacterium]
MSSFSQLFLLPVLWFIRQRFSICKRKVVVYLVTWSCLIVGVASAQTNPLPTTSGTVTVPGAPNTTRTNKVYLYDKEAENGLSAVLLGALSQEMTVSVEVPVPSGSGTDGLAMTATDDDSSPVPVSGQVKAKTTDKAIAIPDVAIRRAENADDYVPADAPWTGEGVVDSQQGGSQSLFVVTNAGKTGAYELQVKNIGNVSEAFHLKLSAPIVGWTLCLFTSDNQEVIVGANGWALPGLDADQTLLLRLEATVTDGVIAPFLVNVQVTGSQASDKVQVDHKVQHIDHLQWFNDDEKWVDIADTTNLQMLRREALGVRAVKAIDGADWGGNSVLGPAWLFQGDTLEGEEVWLHANSATTSAAPVLVSFGNNKTFHVKVLPDAYAHVTASGHTALVTPGVRKQFLWMSPSNCTTPLMLPWHK